MGLLQGKVVNRSSAELFVIETTTNDGINGKPPAVVHRLAPGRKSPKGIDADGFKRIDGKSIQGHKSWWKIRSFSAADIFDKGNDLKILVIWKKAVKEDEFGAYEEDNNPNWGEPIRDISAILKNKKNQTIGYVLQSGEKLTHTEAVKLAQQGELDNVFIYTSPKGMKFLKSKPDADPLNNLKVDSV